MNLNLIMIILGALIVVNFIIILVISKSNKKAPKVKNVEVKTPYIVEEEQKTVITNNVRKREEVEVNNQQECSDIKLEPIPEININNTNEGNESSNEVTVIEVPNEISSQECLGETVIEEIVKPHAIIEFKDGENVKRVEMDSDFLIIGRDPEQCKLVINNDKYLGRKHAKLIKDKDDFYLEDLNSKNGTFIDEVRIEGKVKLEKESFRVGRTILNIYGE